MDRKGGKGTWMKGFCKRSQQAPCPRRRVECQWNRIGMIRMARMLTTLIIGLTAGPAVSL